MTTREQHIKGLRDLADWLEANPDVPVGEHDTTTFQYSVNAYDPYADDWDGACREVWRIASLIKGHVTFDGDGTYEAAVRRFGPGVRYVAMASLSEEDEQETGAES